MHRHFAMENKDNSIVKEDNKIEENNASTILKNSISAGYVNQIPFKVFDLKLVEHFNVLFKKKKIA